MNKLLQEPVKVYEREQARKKSNAYVTRSCDYWLVVHNLDARFQKQPEFNKIICSK